MFFVFTEYYKQKGEYMNFVPSIDDPSYRIMIKSIKTYIKTISLNVADIIIYIIDTLLINKELIRLPYINMVNNVPLLKHNLYMDKSDNVYRRNAINNLEALLELLNSVDVLMPIEDNGAIISAENMVISKNKLLHMISKNTVSMYLDPNKTAGDILTILAKYNLLSINKQKEYIWESLTPLDQNIILEEVYYNDEQYPELYLIENLYKPLSNLSDMLNEVSFMLSSRIINNNIEKEVNIYSLDTFMVDRLTLGINIHQGYPALRAMAIKKLRDIIGGNDEKDNNSNEY